MSSTEHETIDASGKLPFPFKLFQMLKDSDEKGFRHIVSWNSNGKSFKVHDSTTFTKQIVPKYFKQTRYKSFQRQLCLYGFDRVLTGHNKGSRYHCNFVRGDYDLVNEIKYIGIKSKALQQIKQVKKIKQNDFLSQADESSSSGTGTTVCSTDSSFRSKSENIPALSFHEQTTISFTNTSSVEKRPIVSPVASEKDMVSMTIEDPTPLSELKQGLDDIGLFDGIDFPVLEPMLGYEVQMIEKDDVSFMPNTMFSACLAPRQVSCGEKLSEFSSKEMFEAWQRGFEHALSMPPDSCWSFVSENEATL